MAVLKDTVVLGQLVANSQAVFNGEIIASGGIFGDNSGSGIKPEYSNEINFKSNANYVWFGYRTFGANAVNTYKFSNSAANGG
jgi:hypothetical protein